MYLLLEQSSQYLTQRSGIFAFTTGTKTSNTLPGPGVLFSSASSTIADPDAGISTCATIFQVDDWYDNQFIQLKNGALQWKEIAEKPGTSGYAAARNSSNDELHIVVIDDTGKITGAQGAILEKFTFLSKADDAKNSFGDAIYYKNFVSENSDNIFVGIATGNGSIASGIITAFTATSTAQNTWSQDAQDVDFNFVGNKLYELQGGKDYSGVSTEGGFGTSLGNIIGGYEIFENEAEYSVNFLLNGPGITGSQAESQAKANKLIAIAEQRKDCLSSYLSKQRDSC